jgi:hypothetical protein
LAQIAGSYGGLSMIGTPEMIADRMQEWLFSEACDGFNIMFPYVRAASTTSSTGWSPNYSGAASSAANTKARPCAKTSAYRARRTGSSQSGAFKAQHRCCRRKICRLFAHPAV